MFTKKHITQAATFVAKGTPADREDYDHEKNVEQYLRHIAHERRYWAYHLKADIEPVGFKDLVELVQKRADVWNGDVDLMEEYGHRDKVAVLDGLDQEIDFEAGRLVETAKEF